MNYLLTQEELDALKNRDHITRAKAMEEVFAILSDEFSKALAFSREPGSFREHTMTFSEIKAGFGRAQVRVKALSKVDKSAPSCDTPS